MTFKLHDYQLKAIEAFKKQGDSIVFELPCIRSFCNLKYNPVAQLKAEPLLLSPAAKRIGLDILAAGESLDSTQFQERVREFLNESEKDKP